MYTHNRYSYIYTHTCTHTLHTHTHTDIHAHTHISTHTHFSESLLPSMKPTMEKTPLIGLRQPPTFWSTEVWQVQLPHRKRTRKRALYKGRYDLPGYRLERFRVGALPATYHSQHVDWSTEPAQDRDRWPINGCVFSVSSLCLFLSIVLQEPVCIRRT